MLWVPAAKLLIVQAAARALPLPVSARPVQPASAPPLSARSTLPDGLTPVTVAVNVTGAPTVAGFAELDSVVVVGDGVDVAAPKKIPLSTALAPAVLVMRIATWPLTVQTKYWPPLKPVTLRLSSTLPLFASRTSTRCPRVVLSQSRLYSATRCALPSVRFTSTVKLVAPYHVAAIRPVD